MTDLEKEMHKEYQSRLRTGRRVDDAIRAAAIVAERHIEQKLQHLNVSGGLPDYQTLINFLESIKLKHHISDDCWYSCPMSDEGCCNHEEKGCNCGAEAHNKKIDDFIKQHLGKPEQ